MKPAKTSLKASDEDDELADELAGIGPTAFTWTGAGGPGDAAPSVPASQALPAFAPMGPGDAGLPQVDHGVVADGEVTVQAQADTTLIRLDKFRADPRFAGIDGSGLAVAVLDTGIDLDHGFFGPDGNFNGVADRIVYSYNFVGTNAPGGQDGNGHGSNVASIIGSQNGTYTGMAPGVNIISLKVLSDSGSGSTLDIGEALSWVVANSAAYKVVAVNLSLGYGDNVNVATASPFASQFASLAAAGVAVVAASGNSYHGYQSQGVATPSSDPNAWSVGAVWDRNAGGGYYWSSGAIDYSTQADQVISFSQRSASLTTVMAPGGEITGANWNGGTVTYSGTSQAAPHVAGLVADMQQLAFRTSGRFLGVADLEQTMLAGAATIFDGTSNADNVVNTNASYARVDALGWGVQVLAKLFAGTAVADTLTGTVVADTMHGAAGNDALAGNDGGDFLYGDAGNDSLAGGNGADRFYFASGGGADRIVDFSRVQGDRIDLTGVGNVATLAEFQAHAVQSGANTVADFGVGDRLTLDNVDLASLQASDFLFYTPIESIGQLRLAQAGDNYTLTPISTGIAVTLSYQGQSIAAGQFGAWKPIAAEVAGGGTTFHVAWQYGTADTYTVWTVGSTGNYVSQGTAFSGASTSMWATETEFGQDLNGDGSVGAPTVLLEALGSTRLAQVGGGYFVGPASGAATLQLSAFGAPVFQGQFGAFAPIAAEAITGGYEVAWKAAGLDQYTVLNADAAGVFQSHAFFVVSGGSLSLEAIETSFAQDLNGDGTIGIVSSTVEASGATALMQVADSFELNPVAGGSGPFLQYGGATVTVGTFGGWVPVGAEAVGGGYQVAWKLGTTWSVWEVDGGGRYVSDHGALDASGIQAYESALYQDLDGDGSVGPVTTTIEALGTTSLSQAGRGYFLYASGTSSGPQLQYGSAAVTAGQFGSWTPVGAEAVGSGYQVAWKFGGSNVFSVWEVNASGRYVSDHGALDASGIQAYERALHQDLDGDGSVGPVTTTIEALGTTSLSQVGSGYFLYASGTSSGPQLQYGGAAVTAGQFGSWTPVGADAVGSGYQVAWKFGGSNVFSVWEVNASGRYVSDHGALDASGIQAYERALHQDLDGDGSVGPVTTTIEALGTTSLSQVGSGYFLYASGTSSGPQLQYGNAAVTAGQFGNWAPIGADAVGAGYQVAWKLGSSSVFTVWEVNASGQYVSDHGVLDGTIVRTYEATLHQDLNGDTNIGSMAGPGGVADVSVTGIADTLPQLGWDF